MGARIRRRRARQGGQGSDRTLVPQGIEINQDTVVSEETPLADKLSKLRFKTAMTGAESIVWICDSLV